MKEIIEKLQKREKLTEADFSKIIAEQSKQINKLRLVNRKLANVKANEAISRVLFAQYNYNIECLESNNTIESHKIAVECAADNLLKKMNWWQ